MYRRSDCLKAALALGLAAVMSWGAPALAVEDAMMTDEQAVVQSGEPTAESYAEGAYAEEPLGNEDAELVG